MGKDLIAYEGKLLEWVHAHVLLVSGPGDLDHQARVFGAIETVASSVRTVNCTEKLDQEWRVHARNAIGDADVVVLPVTNGMIGSLSRTWLTSEIDERAIPILPVINPKLCFDSIRPLFKLASIQWASSLDLDMSGGDHDPGSRLTQIGEALQACLSVGKGVRRKPPATRRIRKLIDSRVRLASVGDMPTVMDSLAHHLKILAKPSDLADTGILDDRIALDGSEHSCCTLPIKSLREQRVAALIGAIAEYVDNARRERATNITGDRVDCSVYAPRQLPEREDFKIQALLHEEDDLIRAATFVDVGSHRAKRHASDSLRIVLRRGSQVDLHLTCKQLGINAGSRRITWNGQARTTTWTVKGGTGTRLDQPVKARMQASVDGIPLGQLDFDLGGRIADGPSEIVGMVVGNAQAYRRAFVSYAREDFEKVSYYAEAFEHVGIEVLLDIVATEPGADWARWIEQSIPRADLFMLMWSASADKSAWVHKECTIAHLAFQARKAPLIKPAVLERPVPKPPAYLSHLHFSTKYLDKRMAERNPLFI